MIAGLFSWCWAGYGNWGVRVFFADYWEEAYGAYFRVCLFRLRLRRMGWSGMIFGSGIGLHVFAEKRVVSRSHQMVDLTVSLYAKF